MGNGRWGGRARDEQDPKTGRELRKDITPEERARLDKHGSLNFKSNRDAYKKSHGSARPFIPSREQH